MVFPPINWFMGLGGGADELADHYIGFPYFFGDGSGPETSGGFSLGVNDEDTPRFLMFRTDIAEAGVNSVHDQNNADYQNTSGKTAYAMLILRAKDSGAAMRHVKIYSGGTTDSTSAATLLYEIGQNTAITIFSNVNDKMTTTPLAIQDNHYIIVENVDDSRAGNNDLEVFSGWVVERG